MPDFNKVKETLLSAVNTADAIAARISIATIGDRASLIVPFFHGLYPDGESASSTRYFPQQGLTLDHFWRFLHTLKSAGFRFIRPEDIHSGLDEGAYALLTFDDGYANNLAALPVLHEFDAPAVFFISANHVQTGKGFWWDVLYRETVGAGCPPADFQVASRKCKSMRNKEIEEWLRSEFHLPSISPEGDLDRPMTPAELKRLAADRLAVIGNHTLDHAILSNYSLGEATEQIEGCQEELRGMANVAPACIAYPNGNYSPEILKISSRLGLNLGFSTLPGRTRLPLGNSGLEKMALTRSLLWGNRDIEEQSRQFRSAFSFRNAILHMRAKNVATSC